MLDLCGFIVGTVKSRCRKRITILVDGDTFGVVGVDEILNPKGPIPEPPGVGVVASRPEAE